MTADPRAALTAEEQRQLEQTLRDFEQGWTPGCLDARVQQLPPLGAPLRPVLLLGLAGIDLRRRWQAGQQATVEEYLHRYPELGTPETVSVELVLAEFLARQRAGLKPHPEHFGQRFPGKLEELARLAGPVRSPAASTVVLDQPPYSPLLGSGSDSGPGSDTEAPALPEQFGRYRILRRLGQGGMGTVYLAVDTRLDRQVALKVPRFAPGTDPENLQRFYREARATATIHHPNLCPLYDIGEVDGVPYLTMPFIEGWPLTRFTRREKRLSQFAVAATVRKIALAVHEAHKVGVIHRDLKPSNVMINKRGEPIVMDFGLARWVHNDKEDVRLTKAGTVLGAPVYMSPEQVYGDIDALGPACDVYSLGVILYELLTNRLPFEGGNTTAVLAKTLMLEAPKPSVHRPDLDPLLEAICVKALAKAIPDRYPTMLALAEALGEYLRLARKGTQETQVAERTEVNETPTPEVSPPASPVVPAPTPASRPREEALTTQRRPPAKPVPVAAGKPRLLLWVLGGFGLLALLAVPVLAVVYYWASVPRGDLVLVVRPEAPDLEIQLDGRPLDPGQLGQTLTVEAGEHRVVVRGDKQFDDLERVVRVAPGATERVVLELQPRNVVAGRTPVEAPFAARGGAVRDLAVAVGTGVGLSGGDDFAVGVWNVDHHALQADLTGHRLPVTGVALNQAGDVGISCAADLTLRVWDVPGRKVRRVLAGHTDWPRCVSLDAIGRQAASGDDSGAVLIWDTDAGLLRTLLGHASPVRAVRLSGDGKRLLSAGDDGTVRVWDVEAGRQLHYLNAQAGPIRSLARRGDGKQAAAGHADGSIRLWNLDTGRPERVLYGHSGQVRGLAYSADGRRLYSASSGPGDNTIRAWDAVQGTFQHLVGDGPDGFNALTLASDGTTVLTAGEDARIQAWNPNRKDDRPVPPAPASAALHRVRTLVLPAPAAGMAPTPEGTRLVFGCADGHVVVWDRAGGAGLRAFKGHTKPVRAVAVSPDGRRAASGGLDRQVRVWDLASGMATVLTGHADSVLSVGFFPDGKRLASGSADGVVLVWDLATKAVLQRLPGHTSGVTGVAALPDGKRLVSAGLDGLVQVWDATTGRALGRGVIDGGGFTSLALFPDGKRALTAGRDRHFRFWDLATGKQAGAVLAHTKAVTAVAVSPCGRWFASAGEDGLVVRWDSATLLLEQRAGNAHGKPPTGLVFTPDGRALVSCAADGRVAVWDIPRADADPAPLLASAAVREPAKKLLGAKASIETAVLSPDGKTVVAATAHRDALVWDVASGSVKPLLGHTDRLHGAAFLPDGKRAVTCGWDGVARLWDSASGRSLQTYEGHTGKVIRVAVSGDGRYLTTAGTDRTVRLYEVATGRLLRTLEGHGGDVWSVAVSADGFLAVSGSYDRTVRWWNLATGRPVGGWAAAGDIHAVALSPDARRIAAAGKDRVVTLLDVATGTVVARFPGHEATIAGLAFSPDGRLIASGSDDHTARIWNVETGREVWRAAGFTKPVWSVQFSPDGKQLITGSNDPFVAFWDLPEELHPLLPGPERVLARLPAQLDRLALSPDGTLVAVCGMDRTLRLLDSATGREVKRLEGFQGSPRYAVFSPNGKRVLAACEDGTARLWDLPEGTLAQTFGGHVKWVWLAAFSPDGRRVLTGGQDPWVLLHDVATGEVLKRIEVNPRGIHTLCFLPDGRRAILGGLDGSLGVWDSVTGKEVHAGGTSDGGAIAALMLTPDGRFLATGGYDGTVRLWEVATGRQLARFTGSPEQVWSVAVDPLGQRLVSGGRDGRIRVWDVQTGLVTELADHTAGVTAVRLTADGRRLLSSSQDGTVRVRVLPPL